MTLEQAADDADHYSVGLTSCLSVVAEASSGAWYLLATMAAAAVSVALTLDVGGVMSRAELASARFTEQLPWGRGKAPMIISRFARIRPLMLLPLYLITLLLFTSFVAEFR
jgi:hypothetical protein